MQITLNNIAVPYSDASIDICLRSPVFNAQDGSYIFNFTLPASEELKKALGYKHRINASRPVECAFKLQRGSIIISGTALVSSANADEYEVSVGIGKGDFNYLIKDKKLNDADIDWGDDIELVQHTEALMEDNTSYYPPPTNNFLYFPIIKKNPLNQLSTQSGNGMIWSEYTVSVPNTYKFLITIIIKEIDSYFTDNYVSFFKNGVFVSLQNFSSYLTKQTLIFTNTAASGDYYSFNMGFNNLSYIVLLGECSLVVYESENLSITPTDDTFPDRKCVLFPVYNKFIGDSIKNETIKNIYNTDRPWQNAFINNVFPILQPNYGSVVVSNPITPFLYIGYIVETIAKYTGYTIVNNIFRNTEYKRMVLYNANVQMDAANVTESLFNIKPYCSGGDLVNDMVISDFLESIAINCCCVIDVNIEKKAIEFIPIDNIISSTKTVDFSKNSNNYEVDFQDLYDGFRLAYESQGDNAIANFVEPLQGLIYKGETTNFSTTGMVVNGNDYFYFAPGNCFFTWFYDDNTNTYSISKLLIDFWLSEEAAGSNVFEIISKLTPLMVTEIDPYTKTLLNKLVPFSEQKGYFKNAVNPEKNEMQYSVIMYRGLQPDDDNVDYPLGTNHVTRFDRTQISGANISLRIDTEFGLYARWKAFIDFMLKAKKVYIDKQLTEAEFKQLLFSNKYRVFDKNVLLDSVKVRVSDSGIETDELIAFTD